MPFQRPTLAELIQRATNNLNSRLPGTDATLRRANTNALAKVQSGAVHGLYGYLSYIINGVLMYDTCEREYLERWARVWKIYRKPASYAAGPVLFTGTSGAVIPALSELQRADGQIYVLDADVTLVAGSGSGSVTASTAGSAGNTAAGGTLAFISPVAGVTTSVTVGVDGITNGFDEESDEYLRGRWMARLQQPPHGGADFDYIAWALEVPGVTRAWCYPLQNGLGMVGVTFVCDDQEGSIIPNSAKVAEVQAHIEEERPVTALAVNIHAPIAVPLNMTIHVDPDTAAVRADAETQLQDLIAREAVPGGTIRITHLDEAVSLAAGEEDHVISSPTGDVTHRVGEIAVMGTITWV